MAEEEMSEAGPTPRDRLVEERVRLIVANVARIEPAFDASADIFHDLGVDSGLALDLLIRLEEDFAVAIPDEAFGEARSLSKMAKLILDLAEQRQ
jgi:acyl carrier protein